MTICIAGYGHTKFGRRDDADAEALIGEAARAALAKSTLGPEDIDAVFVGAFNNGFGPQDFQAALVALTIPELRFVPAARLENACATGSAAIHAGIDAILAGRARRVLVVGAEKMTAAAPPDVARILLSASYVREEGGVEGGFAGVFGQIADAYFQAHGDRSESLARIAAKNHANATNNPIAHLRKDLGFGFCNAVSDRNPRVAGPLRRTDCSPVSDGAAAVVLARREDAPGDVPLVAFRAAARANDFLPLSRRSKIAFEGARQAWAKAYDEAGVAVGDLSLVETHDCFTIAELMEYEAMGLAEPGQGHRVIDEGVSTMAGRLPVNPSGGLKARGHPIGATGVSQHVMAAMQLAGEAGGMAVPGATLAGVFNMGGAAVANYASILERVR
jgi:acetyl-CoA C-acetyltransferase